MAGVLTPQQVADALVEARLDWALEGRVLVKTTRHGNFANALAYVNAVGALAEAANHHPDVSISWDTVTLSLSTHSAGGITQADLDLAGAIDRMGSTGGSGAGAAG